MTKGFGIFNCLNYLQFPTLLVSLLLTVQDCLWAKRGKDQGVLFTFESISFLFRFCSSMNFCFSWNISSLLVDASVVFLGSSLTPSTFSPGFFSSVFPFMALSVPWGVFSSGRGGRKGPLVSLATSTSHLGAKLTLFRLGLAQKSCFLLSTKATKNTNTKSSQVHLLGKEWIVHRKLWFVCTGILCPGSKRSLCSPSIIRYSQFDWCGWWWSREPEMILHNIVKKNSLGVKAILENVFRFWMDWLHIHGRKRALTWKVERDTKCHPIVCVLSLAFRRE